MGGISILLANVLLVIVAASSLIAFVFLIISVILLSKSGNTKDGNAKNGGKINAKKTGGIITMIISVFFWSPLIILLVLMLVSSGLQEAKVRKELAAIENKITVSGDRWRSGFEYDGKKLIPVNVLINSDGLHSNGTFKNMDEIGALIMRGSTRYYSFYDVENDSGYKMYYVWVHTFVQGKYYPRIFVDENDYDEVVEYYENANLRVRSLWKSAPAGTGLSNTIVSLNLDINDERDEFIELVHQVLDDIPEQQNGTVSLKEYDEHMEFDICSEDGIFSVDLVIFIVDGEMELSVNGYRVDDEVLAEHKDWILSLMKEAQDELLEKK